MSIQGELDPTRSDEPPYEVMVLQLLRAGWTQAGEIHPACCGFGPVHSWRSPSGNFYAGRQAWLAMFSEREGKLQ